MAPDGLFKAYKEVLDEHGILLISDEVQTGWGRTGANFWGIQAHGVIPDMMTFAKGLANGFAIGGVVGRGDLLDGIRGNGISTFGGNPIATTAANATLDYVLSHDLQNNAAVTRRDHHRRAQGGRDTSSSIVGEVRGRGLMFAVDLADPDTGKPSPALAAKVLEAARERGLLIGKGGLYGATLRMAPPLTISEAEAREGLGAARRRPARRRRGGQGGQRSVKHASDARSADNAGKHVTHWIGGKPWTGTAQRHGDIYDPATGQVTGTVDFATPARGRRRPSAPPPSGPADLAARLAGQAGHRPVRLP